MVISTQLTLVNQFKKENVIFSKPEINNITGQKMSYKRIRISIKNQDNSIGDFIIASPENLYSFGLQESKNIETNKLDGYILPICLWNKNDSTQEEKDFSEFFNQISEYCKQYLIDHKDDIEKYDLDYSDLKKFNPLFWKMEKGKIIEGKGPMLYCKVIWNKKNNQINTLFIDEDTNTEIDPFTILNKPCLVNVAIKIESIFIGNKISLQIKLYEVIVKQIDNTRKGLLRPNIIKSNQNEN